MDAIVERSTNTYCIQMSGLRIRTICSSFEEALTEVTVKTEVTIKADISDVWSLKMFEDGCGATHGWNIF